MMFCILPKTLMLTNSQRKALQRLDKIKVRPCNDTGFFYAIKQGRKEYTGKPVNGEDAYFLRTDKGYNIQRKDCTDFERFKRLVLAHRSLTIAMEMWKEDIAQGLLSPSELRDWGLEEVANRFLQDATLMDSCTKALQKMMPHSRMMDSTVDFNSYLPTHAQD
jgi:hypothetical protein